MTVGGMHPATLVDGTDMSSGHTGRRGAAGERRTARLLTLLERRGWAVLHDLAIPGTQANIDCDDPERGGHGEV
jgi:hypothetical protein